MTAGPCAPADTPAVERVVSAPVKRRVMRATVAALARTPLALGRSSEKYLSFWPRRTRSSPVRMTASTRYQINPNPVSRRPLRKERNWNSWVSLLLFPDLLTQVAFVADLANLMELRFQPIDVTFFGLQKTLEQLP